MIGKTVEKVEEQLGYSGDASLVYAGYPFDPFSARQIGTLTFQSHNWYK